jgi:5-methylcytosine-specific restriction protein A
MSSTSRLDKEVFSEFEHQKDHLRKLANTIKAGVEHADINAEILNVREDIEDADFERREGTVLYKYHLARERNTTLVKKKKQQALKLHGKLECELCSFDFFQTYGEVGSGFIECHHRTPLHELTESTVTKLNDLMLVCANCHRMLHRGLEYGKP